MPGVLSPGSPFFDVCLCDVMFPRLLEGKRSAGSLLSLIAESDDSKSLELKETFGDDYLLCLLPRDFFKMDLGVCALLSIQL